MSLTAFAAEPPNFATGGFVVSLQYGPGLWRLDHTRLSNQLGPEHAQTFIDDVETGHTASIGVAYNIMGHVSLGVDLTATGWQLATAERGGGGFVVGTVAWHPLHLAWLKERRPTGFDVSPFFGMGYGLAGQHTGLGGLVFEGGLNVDYFFTKYFGLGLFGRAVFLNCGEFYLDYNNRSVEGNTLALKAGSGGAFITFGLAVHFRAGE